MSLRRKRWRSRKRCSLSSRIYAKNVVENAKEALAGLARASGFRIVSGNTDNHLVLVGLFAPRA